MAIFARAMAPSLLLAEQTNSLLWQKTASGTPVTLANSSSFLPPHSLGKAEEKTYKRNEKHRLYRGNRGTGTGARVVDGNKFCESIV